MRERKRNPATSSLKITAANNDPAKYGSLWWGTAIDGADKIEWFYQHRLYLHTRKEERPGVWINFDPAPGVKAAVLKAIRAAKAA